MHTLHNHRHAVLALCTLMSVCSAAPAEAQGRPYRLPDLGDAFGDRVIWGSEAESPDGQFALRFGGQDQQSVDGRPHTRIRIDGKWAPIHEQLVKNHPLQADHAQARSLVTLHRQHMARWRAAWLGGKSQPGRAIYPTGDQGNDDSFAQGLRTLKQMLDDADRHVPKLSDEMRSRAALARQALQQAAMFMTAANQAPGGKAQPFVTKAADAIERCTDVLAAEPPARALSPLVYEPKSGQFVLFGGDHLDYLTNDTWLFDPRTRTWHLVTGQTAPPPRANHTLKADGHGNVTLRGGYTYSSNTDYVGGQYVDLDDGDWTYHVETGAWSSGGDGKPAPARTRVYRTGPFHPDFYFDEAAPDPKSTGATLAALPANTWVKMNPPHLPRLNRDWGTAVIDPRRDLILRFSGGHSAHGGSDVLHYHLATNRWELCFPVEFPLGQLYANTRYPNGFNLNRRPWVTGHTYKGYAVDPVSGKMLFVGRPKHMYIYDPDVGDWVGRAPKPAGMIYNGCFYDLLMCPVAQGAAKGTICWTKGGRLFRYVTGRNEWTELQLEGDALPGTMVDRAGIVHDTRRDQLVCFRKEYNGPFDGVVYLVDLKTGHVTRRTPGGAAGMKDVGFLREPCYDPVADMVIIGATLPPDGDGLRRTPAYDCANDRWVSLKITGDHPQGKEGRNVSLGFVYDAKRDLFWAVDTNSQAYVLKLDRKALQTEALP